MMEVTTTEEDLEEEVEVKEDLSELVGTARLGSRKPKNVYEAYQDILAPVVELGQAYQKRCNELESIKTMKGVDVRSQKTASLDKDSMNEDDWKELHQGLHSLASARTDKAKAEFLLAVRVAIKRFEGELLSG